MSSSAQFLLDWSRVRTVKPRWPTNTLQHISGASKLLAGRLLQLAGGPRISGQSSHFSHLRPSPMQSDGNRPKKFRHKFLRGLLQRFLLEFTPCGARHSGLNFHPSASEQQNRSQPDAAFLGQKLSTPQIGCPIWVQIDSTAVGQRTR